MIEIKNLTKAFGNFKAVDNISFTVGKGETFILIGTSGCGKTTTLKMINRLIEPTSGTVTINGSNIQNEDAVNLRRKIGYVIQYIGLFPHYTVAQNVSIVPKLLKWDTRKIKEKIEELLNLVGLSPKEFRNRFPHELSGGQKQRVGLARALVADPPVVLLDEPFGALDPITRGQIRAEFKNLESLLKKTMVIVTHDIYEAFELGDRVCLIDGGKIQQIGTPKDLIFSPANGFVESFFSSHRFQLELQVLKLKDILDITQKREITIKKVKEFGLNDSLLYVFEEMEKAAPTETMKESILRVKDESGKPIMEATTEGVMSAFYILKSRLQK
ncbi:MAG: ABC transporter ATP-binding protein [Candidatus Melainabacteria bacterium]|nr:ABC transporter ATP-binding protein [Candidatus Melainabacteria bacterium]